MKYRYELNIKQTQDFEAKQLLNFFYLWLIDKINNDCNIIEEKEYTYLFEPFNKTQNNIKYYRDKYKEKYIYMEVNQTEELNQYLEHTKIKYNRIDSIPEHKKSIQHYNRLLWWYSKTPNNIDSIVKALIESSIKDEFRTRKKSIEISNNLTLKGEKGDKGNKGKMMNIKNNSYKTQINLKGDL